MLHTDNLSPRLNQMYLDGNFGNCILSESDIIKQNILLFKNNGK